MKYSFSVLAAAAALSLAGVAPAAIFPDSLGENFDGNAHMDIKSVTVTNTATDISFAVQVNGPIGAGTDWGKYMVGIDSAAGGDPVGDGWGRPIGMSSGMDFWLGGWADSGNGLELRNWNGSAWGLRPFACHAAGRLCPPRRRLGASAVGRETC